MVDRDLRAGRPIPAPSGVPGARSRAQVESAGCAKCNGPPGKAGRGAVHHCVTLLPLSPLAGGQDGGQLAGLGRVAEVQAAAVGGGEGADLPGDRRPVLGVAGAGAVADQVRAGRPAREDDLDGGQAGRPGAQEQASHPRYDPPDRLPQPQSGRLLVVLLGQRLDQRFADPQASACGLAALISASTSSLVSRSSAALISTAWDQSRDRRRSITHRVCSLSPASRAGQVTQATVHGLTPWGHSPGCPGAAPRSAA